MNALSGDENVIEMSCLSSHPLFLPIWKLFHLLPTTISSGYEFLNPFFPQYFELFFQHKYLESKKLIQSNGRNNHKEFIVRHKLP